jgi:hypothetical protein
VFFGVVRLLIGDPVDRNQRAVEDRVRQPADPGHGRSEVVAGNSKQVDGLADVAPGGTARSKRGKTATRLPVGASFLVDRWSYREPHPHPAIGTLTLPAT